MKPLLFMEERDLVHTFGKLKLVANEVQRMPELSAPAGLNYTGGDTATAAFPLLDGPGAEIFVAVGRPGEPYSAVAGSSCLCSNVKDAIRAFFVSGLGTTSAGAGAGAGGGAGRGAL